MEMLKSYSLKSTSETVVLEVDFLCEEKDMSSFLLERRRAGILMPLFSLPGKYGIGSFSKEAREFVDLLSETGNRVCSFFEGGRAELLADSTHGTDRLRRFSLPELFDLCGKPLFY